MKYLYFIILILMTSYDLNTGSARPYVVFLFMGGGQGIKPFITPFGTGDRRVSQSIESYLAMSIGCTNETNWKELIS